jgi:hypothetical protein
MTSEHLGPVEREEQLNLLWKRMGRAVRRGDTARYEELRAEHTELKEEHIALSHAEVKATMRARRVRERAQEAAVEPQRWKLPRGFGVSPMAAQRAREGRPEVPVVPVGRPALSPWRTGRWSAMQTQIWRP